jgi:hypothetical protein
MSSIRAGRRAWAAHRASSLRGAEETTVVWRGAARGALLAAVSPRGCLGALPAAVEGHLSAGEPPSRALRLAMEEAVPGFGDRGRRAAGVTAALVCDGQIAVASAGRGRAVLCRYHSIEKITTSREKAFFRTLPLAYDMRSLTLAGGELAAESDARIGLAAEVARAAGDGNLAERWTRRAPDRVAVVVDLIRSEGAPPFQAPPESPGALEAFAARARVPCPWCGARSEPCAHCRCVDLGCWHSDRCSGTRYAARGRCYQCHERALRRKRDGTGGPRSDVKRQRIEQPGEDPT